MQICLLFIILICIFIRNILSLDFPPDGYNTNDDVWSIDRGNANQGIYYHPISLSYGHPYDDKRNGIYYKQASASEINNCISKSPDDDQMAIIKKSTNIPKLYDQLCVGNNDCLIRLNIFFSFDPSSISYRFRLMFFNTGNNKIQYRIQLRLKRTSTILFSPINQNIDPFVIIRNSEIDGNSLKTHDFTLTMFDPTIGFDGLIIKKILERKIEYVDNIGGGAGTMVGIYFLNKAETRLSEENLVIEIVNESCWRGYNNLGLAAYTMFAIGSVSGDYNGGTLNCDLRNETFGNDFRYYCKENFGCFRFITPLLVYYEDCAQCNIGCKECIGSPGNCNQCFRNSINYKRSTASGSCTFDHFDVTTFSNFKMEVPPAIHYTITMQFWTWVNNPAGLVFPLFLVYTDFVTIAIEHKKFSSSFYIKCVPLEFVYKVSSILIDKQDTIDSFMGKAKGFYMTEEVNQEDRQKWVHVRCAFDIYNNKAYLNSKREEELRVPQIYDNQGNTKWHQKKFYGTDKTTTFEIKQDYTGRGFVFIKNLFVFRDYIPQNINFKYFKLLDFVTGHKVFPQLLFAIPFNEVVESGGNRIYRLTLYDFSKRTEQNSEISIKQVNQNIRGDIASLVPPRNFKRLLLLPRNSQYADQDFTEFKDVSCNNSYLGTSCFENDEIYICKDDTLYYNEHYGDDKSQQCLTYCKKGFMRRPLDYKERKNSYCNFDCNSNQNTCSTNNWEYFNASYFSCVDPQITHYYRCSYNDTEDVETALHIGSYLQSHQIIFNVSPLVEFCIDFWYLKDLRFTGRDASIMFKTNLFELTTSHFIPASFEGVEIDYFPLFTWNKVIIRRKMDGGQSVYTLNFKGNSYEDIPISVNQSNSLTLSKIYFCKNKNDLCAGWVDSYYKNLRIWDATYITSFTVSNSYIFSDIRDISLLHVFKMDLMSLLNNQIKDSYNHKDIVNIPYEQDTKTKEHNMDGTNLFNYQTNVAFEDIHPGKVLINAQMNSYGHFIEGQTEECSEGCSRCFGIGDNECYSCKDGYALIGNTCKNSEVFYYYRTPASNQLYNGTVSLDLSPYYLQQYKAVTLFFFIKIVSFVEQDINSSTLQHEPLITFDEESKFRFQYTHKDDDAELEISFNNELQFKFNSYREKYLGKWIPVSIATFREYDIKISRSMVQATISYTNQVRSSPNVHTFNFNNFTIHGGWIGLIGDICFYNGFIVNAWGFKKHSYQGELLIVEFPLKSTSKNESCIRDGDFLIESDVSLGEKCIADYNPFFKHCSNTNKELDVNLETQIAMCLGGSSEYDFNVNNKITCDYRDYHFYNFLLEESQGRIVCFEFERVDLARFSSGTFEGIQNPQASFSIDFWFSTQSYEHEAPEKTDTINFKSFTLVWNHHIKVEITKHGYLDVNVSCYPVVDNNNKANDPQPTSFISNSSATGSWVYINCGVNYPMRKTYLTDTTSKKNERQFQTVNTIPSTDTVELIFNEGSPNSFGVSFMAELRLWECYDCSVSFRNIIYNKNDPKFVSVVHAFGSGYPDGRVYDQVKDITRQLKQRDEFIGYNLLQRIKDPIVCDEDNFFYYDYELNDCVRMVNFPRVDNKEYTVLSSRTNRYTMDVWFFVEIPSMFTNGINFIYQKHMGISIIRERNSATSISALCFPQEYKDSLQGKELQGIFDLYNQALNKEQVVFTNSGEKWNYVRCSVDLTRDVFYMNTNTIKSITPEILYGNVSNAKSFRYFDLEKQTKLIIENSQHSQSRVFFRYLSVYNDYFPQTLTDMRYMDIRTFKMNSLSPLVFHIDFESFEETKKNGKTVATYKAYIRNVDGQIEESEGLSLEDGYNVKQYPTYPALYRLNLCKKGNKVDKTQSNACIGVSKSGCSNENAFCLNDEQYFYTINGYVKAETLAVTTNANECSRLPDAFHNEGFCYSQCSDLGLHVSQCQKDNPTASYYNQFKCDDGYQRAYYQCVSVDNAKNSALYFNSFYSFSQLEVSFTGTSIKDHFFEVWFKFDVINTRLKDGVASITKLYFLHAYPHYIYKLNNEYYYMFGDVSNSDNPVKLTRISQYEWNKIIIHVDKPSNNDIPVIIYVNYDANDESVYRVTHPGMDIPQLSKMIFSNTWPIPDATTNPNVIYWGTAWYRNIRIWKNDESSFELIKLLGTPQFDINFKLRSLYYEYPMNINSIVDSGISGYVEQGVNSPTFELKFWYDNSNYDTNFLENYSTNNFDYTGINQGNFINGLNNDKNIFEVVACSTGCSRCYSSSVTECYECFKGFSLYERQCKASTGFYLQSGTSEISLNAVGEDGFVLGDTNPVTITFWMKFLGVKSTRTSSNNLPIITFSPSFQMKYNNIVQLDFQVNSNVQFKYSIKPYIAKWINIGISAYWVEGEISGAFPSMINVMVNNDIITPESLTPYFNTSQLISEVRIGSDVICLFSLMQFYNNYWFGSFGHINALPQTAGIDLSVVLSLSGSKETNCLTVNDVVNGVLPAFRCIEDYNPYEDKVNLCNNDDKVIDHSSLTCNACDMQCITQCYGSLNEQCSSNFREGLFWIGVTRASVSNKIQHYQSERVQNINFEFYRNVTINGTLTSTNYEMSLEFWIYINQYKLIAADMGYTIVVEWYNQSKIVIEGLEARCYPYVEAVHTQDVFDRPSRMYDKTWMYMRCAAMARQKDNYNTEGSYTFWAKRWNEPQLLPDSTFELPEGEQQIQRLTTFSIRHTLLDESLSNYGFVFIRSIRLLSKFHYSFWDSSWNKLYVTDFPYLLHYFENKYTGTDISLAFMYDEVSKTVSSLFLDPNMIGYNYVYDYTELELCEGKSYYSTTDKTCHARSSGSTPSCAVYMSINKCLFCEEPTPYLDRTSMCVDRCEDGYYQDDYVMECRKCEATCKTCFGKEKNNCLSCINDLYLYEDEHICIPDCGVYGLANETSPMWFCVGFNIKTEIVFPMDYKTINMNPYEFNTIEIFLYDATDPNYSVDVEFNVAKTDELNQGKENYTTPVDPCFQSQSFDDSSTEIVVGLTVYESLDPNVTCYKTTMSYAFDVVVKRISGSGSADVPTIRHTYVFKMNEPPVINNVEIVPRQGYFDITLFSIRCGDGIDDNTPTHELKYKIVLNDITLLDFDQNQQETSYKFDRGTYGSNGVNKFEIVCYCMDTMGGVSSTVKSTDVQFVPNIEIYDPLTDIIHFPLSSSLSNLKVLYSYNEEDTFRRIEVFESMILTYNNYMLNGKQDETIIHSNSKDKLKSGEEKLIMEDPIVDRSFCHNHGKPYIIDTYIYCSCDTNYLGTNCHVDTQSYETLENLLVSFINRLQLFDISGQHQSLIINGLAKLTETGATFLKSMEPINKIFDFIETTQLVISAKAFCKSKYFPQMYDYLFDWGVYQVNGYKYQNYSETKKLNGSSIDNLMFDEMRAHQLNRTQENVINAFFTKLKLRIDSLIEYYKDNAISTNMNYKYKLNNFDIYVQAINEVFDYDEYFNYEISNYEMFFTIKECLNEAMKQIYESRSYDAMFTFLNYKTNPYYHLKNYTELFISTLSNINIYRKVDNNLLKISISSCPGDTAFTLYFPIITYTLPKQINDKRTLISPDAHSKYSLFHDPVYIDTSGNVDDIDPSERIKKYFIEFNFSCIYYNEKHNNYSNDGIDFAKYTLDNYIQCQSKHLTWFSVSTIPVDNTIHLSSRFFYLKHYMLIFNANNYSITNFAFFIFTFFIVLLATVLVVWTWCEPELYTKKNFLDVLIMSLLRTNAPYIDEFEYKSGLILPEEVQNKLVFSRKNDSEVDLIKEKVHFKQIEQIKPTSFYYAANSSADLNKEQSVAGYKIKNTNIIASLNVEKGNANVNHHNEHNDFKNVNYLNALLNQKATRMLTTNIKANANPPTKHNNQNTQFINSDSSLHSYFKGDDDNKTEKDNNVSVNTKEPFTSQPSDTITSKHIPLEFISKTKRNLYADVTNIKNITTINESTPLPKLKPLTPTEGLIELYNQTITAKKFFKLNINKRHFYLSSIRKPTFFYGKFKRIANVIVSMCINCMLLSIYLTALEEVVITQGKGVGLFVLGVFVICIITNTLVFMLTYIVYIQLPVLRELYIVVLQRSGLKIMRDYTKLKEKMFVRDIVFIVMQCLIFIASFYFSFGFCATYKTQAGTFGIGFLCVVILDAFVLEFLYEGFITLLYRYRQRGKVWLVLGYSLNQWRFQKCLL